MKKSKKSIIVIVSAVVIAAAILTCFSVVPTSIGARLYRGPRARIDLNIYIDGKKADVKPADGEDFYTLEINQDRCTIIHKADEYDVYEYKLLLNNSIPLTVRYSHLNWWEIIRCTANVDISTVEDSYDLTIDYKYTGEKLRYSAVHEDRGTIAGAERIDIAITP